jgi:hypothetical protein
MGISGLCCWCLFAGQKHEHINKNTDPLDAVKEVGPEVIAMFMSHHQTAGQNHYIKVASTFENVQNSNVSEEQ